MNVGDVLSHRQRPSLAHRGRARAGLGSPAARADAAARGRGAALLLDSRRSAGELVGQRRARLDHAPKATRQNGVTSAALAPASIRSQAASLTVRRKVAVDTGKVVSAPCACANARRNSCIERNRPEGVRSRR
ncbi:MAG: hypothetical protein ING59_03495 [Burkholderiales bacterium]|nr:hypothetical protein [Burkholderiales bacterium]